MPAKRPAPRLALLDESADERGPARPARSHALGSARPRADPARALCRLAACAGVRPTGAGAGRPLPLQDRRCRRGSPNSRFCARRGCGARNTSGSRTSRWPRSAGVKAKTIHDLRAGRVPKSAPKDERAIYDFVQRALQDQARERAHLQAGPGDPWRRRHGRTGRHPRLLHPDRDDAQRLPHAAAGRRGTGFAEPKIA